MLVTVWEQAWNAVVGAVVAVVTLLAGESLPAPPQWTGGEPRVVVFGDSLTFEAQHGLATSLDLSERMLSDELVGRGLGESVSAYPGADTGDLLPRADEVPPPGADVAVVALGTNDLRVVDDVTPVDVAAVLSTVDAAVELIDADCIAFVGVAEVPAWGLEQHAPRFNAELESRADVFGDWAQLVDEHPGYLRRDGVHHSLEGSAAYRDLLADVAEECAGRTEA